MTRHNADMTTLNCTACGQEFDDQHFDDHLRTAHPERWAVVVAEIHRRFDALYPQGWEMPSELKEKFS